MELLKTFLEPEKYGDMNYWNANLIKYEGKEYIVSHKAILTLVTVSSCNAACKFCSNEITYTPNGAYMRYNDDLQRVIAFSKLAGIKKVAFSGGEPTANPQGLYNVAKEFIPNFNTSRIHTNGYGLLRSVSTDNGEMMLLDGLIETGLSGVSLSIAHFDHGLNQDIMRFKGTWKGLTEKSIQEVSQRSSDRFSVRISCILTAKGIKDVDDILRFVEWGRKLGVNRFIFRSPSWIPMSYAKDTTVTRYNRMNHVNIDEITNLLDKRSDFESIFTEHKTDSHVHVYRYDQKVTIDIDASSEEPDPDNKIRRLIIMPNLVTYTSWIDPHAYLFENDRQRAIESAKDELPNLEMIGI